MSATATTTTKPCMACKAHFIGLASNALCPDCEKDEDFYRRTRKKGDKRAFIPYPELFAQWKARRAECRAWRRAAGEWASDRLARHQLEHEKSLMLEVIRRLCGDPDPLGAAVSELATARNDLARLKASADFWRERCEAIQDGTDTETQMYTLLHKLREQKAAGAIPTDMRRRLIQLCHPDRHEGSEASQTATRWLLEGRE